MPAPGKPGKLVHFFIPFLVLGLLACTAKGSCGQAWTEDAGSVVLYRRESDSDKQTNAQSIYGIGYRIGSYLQGFTFLLGLIRLSDVNPNTQFGGIILALGSLIRWWMRFNSDDISISELWVGLAQILIFTTPGTFLVFLSFSYRRRHWKTLIQTDDGEEAHELPRKLMLRDQGLSLAQVLVIVLLVNGTNFAFAFETCGFAGFQAYHSSPSDLGHAVWLGWRLWPASSKTMIAFMFTQAGLTLLCEAFPFFGYLHAWLEYATEWLSIRRHKMLAPKDMRRHRFSLISRPTGFIWDWIRDRVVHRTWTYTLTFLLLAYIIVLIMSVELTIKHADLPPTGSILDMGQILPFLTGLISLLAALATLAQKFSLTETPVRIERLAPPNEEKVFYFQDGDYFQDGRQTGARQSAGG